MKRKFLILTLCFTIIFSSINYKKSYADGGIISLPVLAIVSTLAVGTGIALNNADDIYDIGRMFYDYVSRNNEITWDVIKTTFESVKVVKNNLIGVPSDVLSIVKDFFDSTFGIYNDTVSDNAEVGFYRGYPNYTGLYKDFGLDGNVSTFDSIPGARCSDLSVGERAYYGNLFYIYKNSNTEYFLYNTEGRFIQRIYTSGALSNFSIYFYNNYSYGGYTYKDTYGKLTYSSFGLVSDHLLYGDTYGIPYTGGYTWDNVEDKKEEGTGDLPLPIPEDLGNLLGKNPSDVWDKNYENGLVGNGNLSIPDVDNPSIGIGGATSFPNVSVENPPTDIPDVENPPVGVIPPFPSFGDSLDFSPMYLTNINEKFPFSLPWDIGRLIEKFDVEPKAPIFKVPIVTSDIELDLTIFDEWANIVRFFILIGFALSLILISTKLLG